MINFIHNQWLQGHVLYKNVLFSVQICICLMLCKVNQNERQNTNNAWHLYELWNQINIYAGKI